MKRNAPTAERVTKKGLFMKKYIVRNQKDSKHGEWVVYEETSDTGVAIAWFDDKKKAEIFAQTKEFQADIESGVLVGDRVEIDF